MTRVRLHHSNRLEVLAARLAHLVRTDPGDPFVPERIVVPHPAVGRWLSLELARALGIAANVRFEQPATFAWSLMRAVVPDLPKEQQSYTTARLRWRIHDLLQGPDEGPGGGAPRSRPANASAGSSGSGGRARAWRDAVRGYLRDGDPRKRFELADRLARVFDQCLLYRKDWILDWERGETPHWQARLWQHLMEADGPGGACHWAGALERFGEAFRTGYPDPDRALSADDGPGTRPSAAASPDRLSAGLPDPRPPAPEGHHRPPGWPRRASFFAVPALSPSYLELLCEAARGIELHLFLLNPCREYWGDIHSRHEIDHRVEGADPDARYFTEGNELLAAWGRAGRDSFDALVEVQGAEWEECFVPPAGPGRLAAVQRDILDLRLAEEAARDGPGPGAGFGGDHPDTGEHPDAGAPGDAAGEAEPRPGRTPAADDSLQIHVCHSPVREAEVLHDRLLAIFDAHPDLEPADVLVLTPDLDTYGPAIEAVFAAAGRVPCDVARARAGESRMLRAFLDLLSLPASRYGTEPVLGPLAAPAIRARFGIGEADIATIRGWVREAGIRWGVDEAHRGEEELPRIADHTWRHGLRRLVLGHAVADAGEPIGGLVPCRVPEGGFDGGEVDGELLGRFVSYCEKVFGLRDRLAGRRRPERWGGVLRGVARDFLADGAERVREGGGSGEWAFARELADEAAAVRALIREFENEAGGAESPVPLEVVLDVLRERARDPAHEAARLADGVTVATLGAGRIFPAGVVCVVGMNDGAFPRSASPPSFDLVAAGRARRGDRDIRREDRFAFLEALLAARRCFVVTCTGRGLRDDSPIPPSVLVDELKDYLERRFPGETIETRHPLQPFSPRYFETPAAPPQGEAPVEAAASRDPEGGTRDWRGAGAGRRTETATATKAGGGTPGAEARGEAHGAPGGAAGAHSAGTGEGRAVPEAAPPAASASDGLFSYSRGMCEAAEIMRAGTVAPESPVRFAGVTLPAPDESRRCVDLSELAAFFTNPARFLLRERLGVRLELDDLTLEDEEPFELDGLERYRLRSDIWRQMEAGIDPERGAALLHGSGRLPPAGLGRIAHEQAREEVERLAHRLAPYRAALDAPPRPVDFELGEFRVVGAIEHVEHLGPDGGGLNGTGSSGTGAVRLGADEIEAGGTGAERPGAERPGAERPGADEIEAGGAGAERPGADEIGAGGTGADVAGPARMVWWRMGKLRVRDRIEVRLRQLAWTAAGHGPLEAVVIHRQERDSWKRAVFPPPDGARERLGHWLDAWWRGLATPLPFFPETSFAFAKAVAKAPHDGDAIAEGLLEAAREKARDAWLGDSYRRGERLDSWFSLVHDEDDPVTGDFELLATELLVPLARDQG